VWVFEKDHGCGLIEEISNPDPVAHCVPKGTTPWTTGLLEGNKIEGSEASSA
jgi:hypothetical protein